MTLRTRITVVTALAVAASTAFVAVVVFYSERRELGLLLDADLQRHASLIAEDLLVSGEVDGALRDGFDAPSPYAQVVRPDGDVVSLTPQQPSLPVDDDVVAVASGRRDRFHADVVVEGSRLRTLVVPLAGGALQVGRPVAEVDAHLLDMSALLALVVVAGVGIAVLLGRLVAGTALKPVTQLTAAAERVAESRDLRSRIELSGDDELGRLAAGYNAMLSALDDSQGRQRQLLADASHELRTPLTSVRANLAIFERADELGKGERERMLDDLRTEVESLVAAVDDLLDLARDELVGDEVDAVPLPEVVEETVAWAARRAPGVHFVTRLGPCSVSADRALAQRAVANLLDNAAKWTPTGGTVVIALDDEALTVQDDGPGIDPADVPRVFERFYRAPAARGLPGAGLGLAIVHRIADAHGWEATAESVPGHGAIFRLRFDPAPVPLLTRAAAAESPHASDPDAGARDRWSLVRRVVRHPAPLWGGAFAVAALPLLAALDVVGFTEDRPARLTTMSGALERCDARFCVGDTIVDFGPDWYLSSTHAEHDFDDDGRRSLLADELDGLVGLALVLETDGGRLDADVYTINGLPYRDLTGALPPPPRAEQAGAATPGTRGGTVAAEADPATPPDGSRRLRAVLVGCDDGYCVDGATLDFGPAWYIAQGPAPYDYDADGRVGTIAGELAGLEGRLVTLQAAGSGDDFDVYSINGLPYRNPDAVPPWTGGPS